LDVSEADGDPESMNRTYMSVCDTSEAGGDPQEVEIWVLD